jgi:heme exporter protein A
LNGQPAQISIRLENIEHHFGLRRVFQGVSMQVQTGEIGVILGANGAGKSTLLKIIAGLLPPTSGTAHVAVDGIELDATQRRQVLGYVAPDLTLYRELTGAENLEFFARVRGIRLERPALKTLLELVGLRGRGRDLVGAYSSGMRQRLKYAFALLGQPPILLLDEPTANLDVNGIAIVEQIIQEQQTRPGGGLVIVATNEPREEKWGVVSVRLG